MSSLRLWLESETGWIDKAKRNKNDVEDNGDLSKAAASLEMHPSAMQVHTQLGPSHVLFAKGKDS